MSAIIPLGKFERVPLNSAWPTEDGNFTPWLAEPGVIGLLGEALGLELEVEAVEHWVGSFRADILARATGEPDHRVLIENQFGSTDHKHLGQILTYLAGIERAKTIVWIAETIQPDHRAAIDWLNTYTDDDFSFFAIEIELWRIDNSPPAPRFNVIASPNDWSRATRRGSRNVAEGGLAEQDRLRLAYWTSFAAFLSERKSTFRIRTPKDDYWVGFPIGRANFNLSAAISAPKRSLLVDLYIQKDPEKIAFRQLFAEKMQIENEFGGSLEWIERPMSNSSVIRAIKDNVDFHDESQFPAMHEWMSDKLGRFQLVFAKRVKALNLGPAPEEPFEQ